MKTSRYLQPTVVALLLTPLFLAGCGRALTQERVAQVQTKMTEEQVKAILGAPTEIQTSEALGIRGVFYRYETKAAGAGILFLNEGVYHVEFKAKT